ncbi:MAG: hypothetical protein JST81_02615 [Bacteroidetes bacterium]|nr:hypothetical protein [Bacteroidota bacterium]
MNATIATYYINELNNWEEAFDQHLSEIDEITGWLDEVVQSDTVPQLGLKVEHFIGQLKECGQHIESIMHDIETMERTLSNDQSPLDNDAITAELVKKQEALRSNTFTIEKEWLYLRFECSRFLSETVQAQNKLRNGNSKQ